MSSQLLIQAIRQQLEEDLLEQVREAEKTYRRASADARQLMDYSRSLAGSHPDSERAIENAGVWSEVPFEKYDRVLGIFTELVVNARPSRRLVLNTLLDTAIEIGGADKGAIQVFDAVPGSLKLEAQRGFDPSFLEFFAKGYDGATACDVAFQTSRRVIVEDITQSPIFVGTPCLQVMLEAGLRALQSTPLLSREGQTLGTLSTHYCKATHLSARELTLLDRVSSQAALFIEASGANH